VAATCALVTDAFRLSMAAGDAATTVVLAAALLLLAVYVVIVRGDRLAMAALGGAGALAILAEPLWWPVVVVAVGAIALRHAPHGNRRAALAIALLTLVAVSLPSRISAAHQASGDLAGDVSERATIARNAEFVGRGHGAPDTNQELAADPAGGPAVGLGEYLVGEHSISSLTDGVVDGASDGVAAVAAREQSTLVGLLLFVVQLAGFFYLLILPRLRVLAALAVGLAIVPWFFASVGVLAPFTATAGAWPALLLGAAVVTYALEPALRRRIQGAAPVTSLRRARIPRLRARGVHSGSS
jgi:hypothetical protein